MPILVQLGDLLKCNKGAAPTPLATAPKGTPVLGSALAATVMDIVPITNIVPFGVCQELTKIASGVPTPCVPAVAGPWSPGTSVVKIGKLAGLTDDSTCTCAIGGTIEVSQLSPSNKKINVK